MMMIAAKPWRIAADVQAAPFFVESCASAGRVRGSGPAALRVLLRASGRRWSSGLDCTLNCSPTTATC